MPTGIFESSDEGSLHWRENWRTEACGRGRRAVRDSAAGRRSPADNTPPSSVEERRHQMLAHWRVLYQTHEGLSSSEKLLSSLGGRKSFLSQRTLIAFSLSCSERILHFFWESEAIWSQCCSLHYCLCLPHKAEGAGWELVVYRLGFNVETKQGFLEVGWAVWPLGSSHWEQSLELECGSVRDHRNDAGTLPPLKAAPGLLVSTWKWITGPYFYQCLS